VIAGEHIFWITSRAAGGAALILASAAVAVGLMVSAKRPAAAKSAASKGDLRAIHEALSLTTLAMVALHGLSLLGDSFLNPGLTGIAIPFVGSYRPLWTGLGIVAGYGLAGLGLTYYLRDRIGAARWRLLHRFTAVFWVLAIIHTIGAGSDAAQLWFLIISGAVVIPAALLVALRWADRWWSAPVAPRAQGPAGGAPPTPN
jgi:sulfoxide reductase heme-binding subunit YedZ